jgi:RHS repeat-associated protein
VVAQRTAANTTATRVTRSFYDGLGRQIQTKVESALNAQSIVTDMRYDGLGQVIEQSQPRYVNESTPAIYGYTNPGGGNLFNRTTITYDALGRASEVTAPDGSTTSHFYLIWSDAGTLRQAHNVVDANRHRTKTSTDALGRLVKVEEISGNCGQWTYTCGGSYIDTWTVAATTTYAYSPLDQLTSVTDTSGNVTSMTYDSLGRKTAMDDPDMGVWSYSYDATGNLVTQTDAKSQVLWFGYDALDRQTQKRQTSASGTPLASYTYDQTSATNKGIGQRTESNANGIKEQWEYDARGRSTKTTYTVPGLSGTRVFGYGYDSADRVLTLDYPALPNGQVQRLTYSYDAAGRPNRLYTNIWNTYLINNATYTALDQPDQWTFNNGIIQNWSYGSPMQRLSRLQAGPSATPSSVFDRSYTYDNASNVKTIVDNTTAPIPNQSYSYDHRDRLTSWTLGSTTQTYTYNMLGNITSKPGNGVYTYPAAGSARPHTPSAVNGATYSYDANGNLTSGGGRNYTWNIDNLPASISHVSGSESYTYDADGERVKKVAGSVTTVYLAGLREEVVGGAVKHYYIFNGQTTVMYTSSPSAFTYLTNDHLGSASVATSQTQAKTQQEFDPWGKVRTGGTFTATSINFTGQRLDGTGLLYYHARMYDPLLGRFVSADTIVPNLKQPQQLNRYTYVANNPLKNTDPTGHCSKSSVDQVERTENHRCAEYTKKLGELGVIVKNVLDWQSGDLELVLEAISDLMREAIWTPDQFRKVIGGSVDLVRGGASGYSGYENNGRITLYDGAFNYGNTEKQRRDEAKRVFVHEIAHRADEVTGGKLTRNHVEATGGKAKFCISKLGWCASYEAKDIAGLPRPGDDYYVNDPYEDFAESLALTVYPHLSPNKNYKSGKRYEHIQKYFEYSNP